MNTKYTLGQIIRQINDPAVDSGPITHISINNDRVIYTISVKDWDRETRTVLDAVKHIPEDEAVLLENPPASQTPEPSPTAQVQVEEQVSPSPEGDPNVTNG